MSKASALAVVIAALDGHNPNITKDRAGNITAHPGAPNGPSDLALAIDDLLYEDLGGVKIAKQHPTFAARDLAACAIDVAIASLASVGHDFTNVDRAAIARQLRTIQRAAATAEHGQA